MASPIHYKSEQSTRFSDLDLYGHVNSKHYLDYIITSRWSFAEKELNWSANEIIKKGIGFYLIESNMKYPLPLAGIKTFTIDSWVEEVSGPVLHVPYAITNTARQKTYSDGVLKFMVIDLKTNRPTPLPEWANELFWSAK